jgi:hypothetical protein
MILLESAGLRKAYKSVLSANGSLLINGASLWLDAAAFIANAVVHISRAVSILKYCFIQFIIYNG